MKKESKKLPSMIINSIFILVLLLTGCKEVTPPALQVEESEQVEYSVEYIMGQFDPKGHSDFVVIPSQYADRDSLFLRKDALEDFIRMYNAALEDNIKLVIRSATRNFSYQKRLWEAKWTGNTNLSDGINAAIDIKDPRTRALKILEYSSMPGTSRHHWGTDIDLNSFNNKWFESGEGLKLYNWMQANAHLYGYCQPYIEKGEQRPYGYNEEKWHWSYTPVSTTLIMQAEKKLKNEMIMGFQGYEQAPIIDVVTKYVLGINPECK